MQCERDRAVLLMNIHVFLDKSAKFTIPLDVIRSTKLVRLFDIIVRSLHLYVEL